MERYVSEWQEGPVPDGLMFTTPELPIKRWRVTVTTPSTFPRGRLRRWMFIRRHRRHLTKLWRGM